MDNNKINYEQLYELINNLVEKKVNSMLQNYGVESSSFGVVDSIIKINNDANSSVLRASVKLPDGTIVENLYNATGQQLKVGDMVKIYGSESNISNRFIGTKYEREVINYAE